MAKPDPAAEAESTLLFAQPADWAAWLDAHADSSSGVWLRLSKKGAAPASLSYSAALEVALCQGWIDGKKKALDQHYWLQRFTPRSAASIWSAINRDKALQLIRDARMQPAGLAEIERAKQDGRWQAAYDSASKATVAPDLQRALDASPRAKAFFATLDARNRYAILFRVQTAKKADTRARRIAQFVAMLSRHEKIHP
jgi:uncharacterized protein YdeI (YjbR/CyaY-like superfamily)